MLRWARRNLSVFSLFCVFDPPFVSTLHFFIAFYAHPKNVSRISEMRLTFTGGPKALQCGLRNSGCGTSGKGGGEPGERGDCQNGRLKTGVLRQEVPRWYRRPPVQRSDRTGQRPVPRVKAQKPVEDTPAAPWRQITLLAGP